MGAPVAPVAPVAPADVAAVDPVVDWVAEVELVVDDFELEEHAARATIRATTATPGTAFGFRNTCFDSP